MAYWIIISHTSLIIIKTVLDLILLLFIRKGAFPLKFDYQVIYVNNARLLLADIMVCDYSFYRTRYSQQLFIFPDIRSFNPHSEKVGLIREFRSHTPHFLAQRSSVFINGLSCFHIHRQFVY